MISKNITLSSSFFHKKIIDKSRKWKKMAVSYPFLVYNKGSRRSGVLKSEMNFILSLHLQKQNTNFFNIFWNSQNTSLIYLTTGCYQSQIDTIIKNSHNIFSLSTIENRSSNFNKKNSINKIMFFLKSRNATLDTAYISKDSLKSTFLLNNSLKNSLKDIFYKDLLSEKHFKDLKVAVPKNTLYTPASGPILSCIENTIANKIERATNNIKKPNLLFFPKIPENLLGQITSECLKNNKLSNSRSKENFKFSFQLQKKNLSPLLILENKSVSRKNGNINKGLYSLKNNAGPTDTAYISDVLLNKNLLVNSSPRDLLQKNAILQNRYPALIAGSLSALNESNITNKTESTINKIKHQNLLHISKLRKNLSDQSSSIFLKKPGFSRQKYFLKSPVLESKLIKHVSESVVSWIERTITNKIERATNNIKSSNLLFFSKAPEILSDQKDSEFLRNSKFSSKGKKEYFILSLHLQKEKDFPLLIPKNKNVCRKNRNINKGLYSLKNKIGPADTTYISKVPLKNALFSNSPLKCLLQKNAILHSEHLTLIAGSIFSRIESNITNKTEKTTNKIKDLNLLYISQTPKNLSNQPVSGLLKDRKLSKDSPFLKNITILSRVDFTRSTIPLRVLNLSTGKKSLGISSFSSVAGSFNSSVFSAVNDLLNNLNFSNVALQLRNISFSKVSSLSYAQNLMKKSLIIIFPEAKKRTELKKMGVEHHFAQNSNPFQVQDSIKFFSKFEREFLLFNHILNLPLENLIFSGRTKQFPVFINKVPAINKKFMLSFPDTESGNKEVASAFMNKELLLFAAGNKNPYSESSKNLNFQKNGENLILYTQSDMEQKIEEKIEQFNKAAAEAKKAISEQSRVAYSTIGENQKHQMDINHISDQVFRLMEHRLIIERERRGIL